jgi:DNA-binding HxlR family transcriptional regulator
MHRYGQFCPIAIACEIVAERWTPLMLRDLALGRRCFNDLLRGLALISRTLLAQRLRRLESAGLLERRPKRRGRGCEYRLTPAGESVQPVVVQLGAWARRWIYPEVMKRDLDPGLLMWDLHRRLRTEALPPRRIVVQFDLRGLPRGAANMKRWWLVLEKPEVELCLTDPGYEVDLVVAADLFALTRLWMGELNFQDALRRREIALQGRSSLVKAFPGWLKLSVFARGAERDSGRSLAGPA